MKTLYLLEWYIESTEQVKRRLYSDKDEAECYCFALESALSGGWIALQEIVEENPSRGFVKGDTLYYKEIC